MELVKGETLQNAMPTMTASEKREALAATAEQFSVLGTVDMLKN